MKKNENFSGISNEIIEIHETYQKEAKDLASKLSISSSKNVFIEIDCVPNGSLNPINYKDGFKSYEIISSLTGSNKDLQAIAERDFEPIMETGVSLGVYQKIHSLPERLDWNEPFCVKNKYGLTRIWHPEWRRLGHLNGFSTRTAMQRFIFEEGVYYQKFYTPILTKDKSKHMIYRLVFFCAPESEPKFVGGLWIARPGFKIYLEKDSTIGLLKF